MPTIINPPVSTITFGTITEAKNYGGYVDGHTVYIEELGRWYYATQVADPEDPPLYKIIDTISTFKLKRANKILENSFRSNEGLRVNDELAVGSIEKPSELIGGEGDSTPEDMLTYQFDSSSYIDISADAASDAGSQFTFANNAVNNAIYCTLAKEQNGVKYIPKGLKVKMETAGSYNSGELVFEYFTGLTWSPLNVMAIKDVKPYYSHADQPFQSTTGQSEQIYFNIKSALDWADTDPMSLGTAYKWFRIRLTTSVATLPVFEQFKVHTSRSETNPDGFVQKFGDGRTRKDLGWSLGDLEAANNSPDNADVYPSDNLGVGRIENLFQDGTTDRAALNIRLPKDLDTSSPIKLRWSFTTNDALGGDTRFVVRTAYTRDGDNVYRSAGAAPTTHPTQVDIVGNNTIPGLVDTQFTNEVEIDVSKLNANPISGSSNADILWVSLERTGGDVTDTHSGSIAIISFDATYISWAEGSFAAETNLTSTALIAEDWESGSFTTPPAPPLLGWTWTPVNSAVNANEWVIGSAQAESGTNGCYISIDSGVTASYATSTPDSVAHLYVDVPIPGSAVASTLTFNWLCDAEDGPSATEYDFMKVYAVSTSTTPVADTLLPELNRIGEIKYNEETTWQSESIVLPGTFIGSTVRIVFSFNSDFSVINNPGACIDNIQVSYLS